MATRTTIDLSFILSTAAALTGGHFTESSSFEQLQEAINGKRNGLISYELVKASVGEKEIVQPCLLTHYRAPGGPA